MSTTTTKKDQDPITCHALNTLTGTPAAHLTTTLLQLYPTTVSDPTPARFTAVTDTDGRVRNWSVPITTTTTTSTTTTTTTTSTEKTPTSETETDTETNASTPLARYLDTRFRDGEKSIWSVRFDVGPWFEEQGVESFWPEVEVKFTVVKKGSGDGDKTHVHVPVLVGPWSYTTYRGS